MNTNLDTFNEASLFVIPAELTNRIDNLVHIPDGHSVHLPVKFVEIRFDFIVVIGAIFIEALVNRCRSWISDFVKDRVAMNLFWLISLPKLRTNFAPTPMNGMELHEILCF